MKRVDDCLFCKIIAGDIPAEKIYEDDDCLAFRDIDPKAPTHILLIPKTHIPKLADTSKDENKILGHLMERSGEVARITGISESGYRVIVNNGADAGQEVFHLHLHILGGCKLPG